jgi:hypothetical protein
MVSIMAFSSGTIDFDVVYSLVEYLDPRAALPVPKLSSFLPPFNGLRRCPIGPIILSSLLIRRGFS